MQFEGPWKKQRRRRKEKIKEKKSLGLLEKKPFSVQWSLDPTHAEKISPKRVFAI